jgi:hypothetical protein
MDERPKQSAITKDQETPRKPYTLPQLTRHGTVVELTGRITADFAVGSGILTDTFVGGDED